MSQPSEHLQHLPFEGVVRTGHTDLPGDLVEVGSVLGVSLITSGGTVWNRCSGKELAMEPSSA